MPASDERRRLQRARPVTPLRARAAQQRAFVVDISLCGLRVAHQDAIGEPGATIPVQFEWDGSPIDVTCTIRWSKVQNVAKTALSRTLWHSGLEIETFAAPEMRKVIRELVADLVARALDEQKANAHGLPPTAAMSIQTGAAKGLIRHEHVGGSWKSSTTDDQNQPANGFTVSAEHPESEVEMLRSAFETADADGKEMIRKLAGLSIGTAEGIPMRRYRP